jgi:hypothetical protein
MSERVTGSASPISACFDETLEELDTASAKLEQLEDEITSRIQGAIVGTVKTAVLCIGGTLDSPPCITAAAQHLEALWTLQQLSVKYEQAVADYEDALSAHFACLTELE